MRIEYDPNDPHLSRLKCIGYKYGYNDVMVHHIPRLLPYCEIIFIKYLNFAKIAEYDIEIPIEVIKKYNYTNDFNIIADYVEKDLKNQHEKSKHYV